MAPTLASLAAQTFKDWELVLVDDASAEDPTPHVLAHIPQARVIRLERNSGPSAARNRGIDSAQGRFVAFLDSDDLWEPTKLAAQVAAVHASVNPEHRFCVVRTRVINGAGAEIVRPRRAVAPGERFDEFLFVDREFAQVSSFFLAREAAQRIRFPENLRQYEDYLFFLQAGAMGMHYLLVEQPLVTWMNDDRADRLSRTDSLPRALQFLALAGDAMNERSRLAFQVRFLGPALFHQSPGRLMTLCANALRCGAVTPKDIVVLATKLLLPGRLYKLLKRKLGS